MRLIPFFPILLLLLAGCRSGNFGDDGRTVFRYNESAGITSLDPAYASNQANIWAGNQLYNGLVQLDEQLKVKPCIAYAWEISSDGTTYTFHLRRDVFFHDDPVFPDGKGRRVVAGDFVYSLNRLLDEKTASPGAWVLVKVRKTGPAYDIRATDDSTLSIGLTHPFPPFPGLLSMIYCSVIPKEAVDALGKDFRSHPVGTGPFRFGIWKEGVKLVLLKNPHYFETGDSGRLPFLDAVSVTFIVDKQTAFLEFVKGNLDLISGIDAGYKDELLTREGTLREKYRDRIRMTKQPYLNTEYLGILVDTAAAAVRMSPLRNRLIRQAVNYGFDRVRMMKYLRNNIGKPGTAGFVPPGLPGFDQNQVRGYQYDPGKARQLLAQAGFPGGRGMPPIVLSTNASYLDLCRFIQSQLGEIGIPVKLDVTPPATLREMIARSAIGFFRGSWIADYPDAENYLSLFSTANFCPAGPNYTHFSDTRFDRLYSESMNETNDSMRGIQYMKMDNLVTADAPFVILYYDEVLRFTRKNIEGLGSNPMNLLTLKNVKKTHEPQ
jgi:oligopeptide transport system substrate-binding protein